MPEKGADEMTFTRSDFERAYRRWKDGLEELEFPDLPAVPESGEELFQILRSSARCHVQC